MRGEEYSVDTVGDWDLSLPFESSELQGCLRGFYGQYDTTGNISKLGFNYQYDRVWQCSQEHESCKCHGKVHFGPARSQAGETIYNYKQMKQEMEANNKSVATKEADGTVHCGSDVFGDPWTGVDKQCFCEHI